MFLVGCAAYAGAIARYVLRFARCVECADDQLESAVVWFIADLGRHRPFHFIGGDDRVVFSPD